MLHYAVCRKHQSSTCISGERNQTYNGARETRKLVFSNYTVRMRIVNLPFRLHGIAFSWSALILAAPSLLPYLQPHIASTDHSPHDSCDVGPADYRGDYWTAIGRNDSLLLHTD